MPSRKQKREINRLAADQSLVGHARKMFARVKELNQDVPYYENIEGGHGGAANNKQAAYMQFWGTLS